MNFYDDLHKNKYRLPDETFVMAMERIANGLGDDEKHYKLFLKLLLEKKFLPAGRIQRAIGAGHKVTAVNCFVMQNVPDDMEGIMKVATDAALTMKMGGGVGYNFSQIRPRGDIINSLGSSASGPVSFMHIFDSVCKCISSAGNRRGAQMSILSVSHPDIEEFIEAKHNNTDLTAFNLSISVPDLFMVAVKADLDWDLVFDGKIYKTLKARDLFEKIMKSTWDWAEPGVVFIDRMNDMNNLFYCEELFAVNPSMPAGIKVHTNTGIVPIESLENKTFKIRSMDGEWVDAKCFLSSPLAEVLEITFKSGKKIRATKEHNWPVYCRENRIVKVSTVELEPGDRIPLNLPMLPDIESSQNFTENDGFAVGMLMGDGWWGTRLDDGRHFAGFIVSNKEPELAERLTKYWKDVWDYNVHLDKDSETSFEYGITKSSIIQEFLTKFGVTDKASLPTAIWEANNDFIKGFIDGIFSSDGGVSTQNARLSFVNKDFNFIEELCKLLSFCGIKTSKILSRTKEAVFPNGKDYDKLYTSHEFTISGINFNIFFDLFRLTSIRKQHRAESRLGRRTQNNFQSRSEKVESVRLVSNQPVWDISVNHFQHVFPTEWVYTGNCSEQPLPEFGACILGSFNLTKYISTNNDRFFNFDQFELDIPIVVRAMDNVIDKTLYPLEEQKEESHNKRRMGIGYTGLANAIESLGHAYGSDEFLQVHSKIAKTLMNTAYSASSDLAKEKGSFPAFTDKYLDGQFFSELSPIVRSKIEMQGLRNSHLVSIAPTGSISLTVGNVSSGLEPVFAYDVERNVLGPNGIETVHLTDYGVKEFKTWGKTTAECSIEDHLKVMQVAQDYCDSAVSKTINVPPSTPWHEFKETYFKAWGMGLKSVATFNIGGKRFGMMVDKKNVEEESIACYIDPETGIKTCE